MPAESPASARERWLEAAAVALTAVAGFGLGLKYARMGFMPLDQAIGFDGGWRVLSGELPLRDYLAPNGFPMHALAALFFAVFGVTWFAYCVHAAVLNAAAAVLAHRVLRRFEIGRWSAFWLASITAVMFTPPFGPPYMDTHAFAFSLAALVASLAACFDRSESVRRRTAWAVGPLLALAYLSKQIPSVFFLPACLACCAFAPEARLATLKRVLISLAATAAAILFAALAAGVDFELVDLYVRQLPSEEGARRLGYVPGVASVLRRFEETRVELEMWSIAAVHVVGIPSSILGLVFARRAFRDPSWRWRKTLGAGVLAEFLLLACLGFVALTSNDKEIGVPLVFVALGVAASAVARAAAALGVDLPGLARAIVTVAILVGVRDARAFDRRVNDTRLVDDLIFDEQLADASASDLPEALSYVRWSVPELVTYSPGDLRDLTAYLRGREGAFFLVGDCSVLYGITGKPSVFPALWFHPGLTFPSTADERFAAFEERLLERFERFDVRTVVLEPRVWIGDFPARKLITLEAFPRVAELVNERRESERSIGAFRVIELR